MNLKKYKSHFIEQIELLYDAEEAESFFYLILEKLHQMKRIDLALNPAFEISDFDIEKWNLIVSDLEIYKPIQYILGETEFFGLKFSVDSNTLIPRPETEELVALILKICNAKKIENPKTLDIGTGSGCIAISLAKNLSNAKVFGLDVSEKALQIAETNAKLNQVEVDFILQNILEVDDLTQQFDIIVSNPPYVRNLEKHEISKNVLDYEPHLALFVEDNDALLFYRKIALLAQKNLSENGLLFFEINQYLGKETMELVQKLNFKNIQLKQDVYGNDRMILCEK